VRAHTALVQPPSARRAALQCRAVVQGSAVQGDARLVKGETAAGSGRTARSRIARVQRCGTLARHSSSSSRSSSRWRRRR
jgi:hypothetical protein